jgi:hypothetical protein
MADGRQPASSSLAGVASRAGGGWQRHTVCSLGRRRGVLLEVFFGALYHLLVVYSIENI